MEEIRILSSEKLDIEREDLTLRPKSLDEFIGQTYVKDNLKIFLASSKKRNVPLEHILLSGPPGLGKTTVANILASEMNANAVNLTGPSLRKIDDILPILISLERGDILFIDEIHGLPRIIEEILYPAMEDFTITLSRKNKDRGDKSDVIRIRLKRFTLVGATTRIGTLSNPFRDRFGILLRFDLYSQNELIEVIRRSSSMMDIPITPEGVIEIASRSRGTPRIANRLLRRVRDFTIVKGFQEINKKITETSMISMRIDKLGLDDIDRRIISNIYQYYNGGPVGIKTIAMSVGEEVKTIEDVYEPYLTHIGFLKRTPGGREVTPMAIDHLRKLKGSQLDIKLNLPKLPLVDKEDVIEQ